MVHLHGGWIEFHAPPLVLLNGPSQVMTALLHVGEVPPKTSGVGPAAHAAISVGDLVTICLRSPDTALVVTPNATTGGTDGCITNPAHYGMNVARWEWTIRLTRRPHGSTRKELVAAITSFYGRTLVDRGSATVTVLARTTWIQDAENMAGILTGGLNPLEKLLAVVAAILTTLVIIRRRWWELLRREDTDPNRQDADE